MLINKFVLQVTVLYQNGFGVNQGKGIGLGNQSLKLRCTSCACPVNRWQPVTSVDEQKEIEKIIENE